MNSFSGQNDPSPRCRPDPLLRHNKSGTLGNRHRESVVAILHELEAKVRALKLALANPQEKFPSSYSETQRERVLAQEVRRILKRRRMRSSYFDAELFAEPAWDILLEVFAADLSEQRLSVSGACSTPAVPRTTALRWLRKLEEIGLIVRTPDPLESRREWVSLSTSARVAMQDYLSSHAE